MLQQQQKRKTVIQYVQTGYQVKLDMEYLFSVYNSDGNVGVVTTDLLLYSQVHRSDRKRRAADSLSPEPMVQHDSLTRTSLSPRGQNALLIVDPGCRLTGVTDGLM